MRTPTVTPECTIAGLSPRIFSICILMLLATMLNYMDRQALAQQATAIGRDLQLSNHDYGVLESVFGLAFAVGGLAAGFATDRLGPRYLYPSLILAWSAVGFATGLVRTYNQLYFCRMSLGFFEAGMWPCALVSAQRLLGRKDRPFGNSLIQSGASLGAIATPAVVILLATPGPGGWRIPFQVIGGLGLIWCLAWLLTVRPGDLELRDEGGPELAPELDTRDADPTAGKSDQAHTPTRWRIASRLLAVINMVIVINLCFQFFRAWMPKMLLEQLHYTDRQVQLVSIAFYIAADLGCLAVGYLVKRLAVRQGSIHAARMTLALGCSLLTALSTVAAWLDASWLLLILLLVIAFGALGIFPLYYAFTQEITAKQMGNLSGMLGFAFWFVYGMVQGRVGALIDHWHSYSPVMFVAGLLPMLGFLGMLLLWNPLWVRSQPARS